MKKAEIRVGSVYIGKVNNKLVRVRVDAIKEDHKGRSYYEVTNLVTGRKTSYRSAAKFRAAI